MKIALYIIIGIGALCGICFFLASMGLSDIKKMVVNDVDLSKVADGVYRGKFHKVRWNYEFEVTVKDHKIIALKPTVKIKPGWQKVVNGAIDAIIKKQSVRIDVVSGATVDTKAVQKAVENALTGGARQ
ncbi:MAG: FMN-binding protein [Chitinispirillaceae bacterium]|nr:FMN-binding protein [Chitinispirillaceae bacterium]